MIREALEYLSGLATRAEAAEAVEIKGVESKTVIAFGSELKEYPHEPAPCNHVCSSIESLGAWCGESGSNIWYGMDRIVLVLDALELRRNTCTMPLQAASAWKSAIKGIRSADQPTFLRWCLDNLGPELEHAVPGFLQTMRQLKFSAGSQGEGEIQNGKESFGKSVSAAVAGATSFPDEIVLRLLVWAELDIQVFLTMAFIVDPHEGTFTLKPLDSSAQHATRLALDQLGEVLEEHKGDSGLYCGSP